MVIPKRTERRRAWKASTVMDRTSVTLLIDRLTGDIDGSKTCLAFVQFCRSGLGKSNSPSYLASINYITLKRVLYGGQRQNGWPYKFEENTWGVLALKGNWWKVLVRWNILSGRPREERSVPRAVTVHVTCDVSPLCVFGSSLTRSLAINLYTVFWLVGTLELQSFV